MKQWKFDCENFYSFASVDNPFFLVFENSTNQEEDRKILGSDWLSIFDSLKKENFDSLKRKF